MITWTDSLEIGVRSIDAEHKRLIEFINLVETVSASQRSRLNNVKLLSDLRALLQAHFEKEEDLMFGIDYPGVNTHMTAHSTLQSDFGARILETGHSGTMDDAVGFVADWMLNHLKTEDASLALFIRQKKTARTAAAPARRAAGAKR
ncbi:MAG: hemerythrin domain-containing protein [Rhodospirillaceae bacterium]